MILAHSIALDPTQRQAAYFSRAAGVARFSYNNALEMWNRAYEADGKVDRGRLKREFNATRQEKFPWMGEVSSCAYDYPWIQLRQAFSAFFHEKSKHPKFRTKRRGPESFYVHNREMEFDGRTLHIGPKKFNLGPVRLREELRLQGKVVGATIRKDVDRWFISVQVDVGDDYRKSRVADGDVGVDLGVLKLATLSTGEMIEGLRPLAKALEMLRRLSRRHSRKKKGSRNSEKSRLRLARLHRHIRNVRRDFLHRLTTRLCRENQTVAIEDLSVRWMMMCSRGLARLIADMGWYEFRRQLVYKCPIYGTRLKVAGRFFPSSKTCSCCGAVRDELPRGERTFRCGCGLELDRDLNAALNLLYLLLVPVNDGEHGPAQSRAETPAEREALAAHCAVKPRLDEAGTQGTLDGGRVQDDGQAARLVPVVERSARGRSRRGGRPRRCGAVMEKS